MNKTCACICKIKIKQKYFNNEQWVCDEIKNVKLLVSIDKFFYVNNFCSNKTIVVNNIIMKFTTQNSVSSKSLSEKLILTLIITVTFKVYMHMKNNLQRCRQIKS
jgi:DNA replication protein DnaC